MEKKASRPKIVYKNDSVDLRPYNENEVNSNSSNGRQNMGTTSGKQNRINEKGLVNNALKKLATSYKAINNVSSFPPERKSTLGGVNSRMYNPRIDKFSSEKQEDFKSKSEINNVFQRSTSTILCPSSPTILSPREEKRGSEKIGPRNKFTMTQPKLTKEAKGNVAKKSDVTKRIVDRQLAREPEIIKRTVNRGVVNNNDYQPVWKDQRLVQKYSILKVPFTRSNTLPMYRKPTQVILQETYQVHPDVSDKKTYLYDESDAESAEYEDKRRIFGQVFQTQFFACFFIIGLLCGMAFLAILTYLIVGNDLLYNIFQFKEPENPLKTQIRYLGGGIIHLATQVFKTMGRLFSIPAQEVFQPSRNYYLWNYAADVNRL